MPTLFALMTRGLERVAAEEIAGLTGVRVGSVAYRRVSVEADVPLERLLELRTVDDIYLRVADWTDVGHTRDMLPVFEERATGLMLEDAVAVVAGMRAVAETPTFSVTASFVGKRNYTADEIKKALSHGIQAHYGWSYVEDDREAALNIRVFIEKDEALIGVRLGSHPLHERSYKQVERVGSLRATVAAAMLRLGGVQKEDRVLDPCCGAGTIVIEAGLIGARATGGDLKREAQMAARQNARAAGVNARLEHWDARKLPVGSGTFEYVVSNLPWGRQVEVDDALVTFYREVCEEVERVLVEGGRAVLLTSTPQLLYFERLKIDEQIEISLYGQRPVIVMATIR